MGSPRKKPVAIGDVNTALAVAGDVLDRMPQPVAVIPQSETAQVMSMIERIALDPNADMDKIERLMVMKKDLEAEKARREYGAAMAAAQGEMPRITKTKKNNQTHSMYAALESITEAINPVYTKHGFSLSFDNMPPRAENWVCVRCRVRHAGGHMEEFVYDTPIDDKGMKGEVNKTLTHGIASAVSYARRYITMLIFNLVIAGEDNDGNGSGRQQKLASDEEQLAIKEWMDVLEFVPDDMREFLELYKVDAIAELPANRVREVISALKLRAKNEGRLDD